jgi:hypothetical protein
MTHRPPGSSDRWFPAEGETRAVALVLGGLNLAPARMESLCALLGRLGVESRLAVFTGHDGDLGALRKVRRADFLADAGRGWDEAARRARELGRPLLLAAFSLGAVVGNDLLHAREETRFDAMLLFAPAFTPRPATRLLRLLWPFRRLVLPSASPAGWRANRGTSIAAYRALFDSAAALEARGFARSNLPATVFVDPRDELVSLRALRRLAARHGLGRWRFVELTRSRGRLPRPVHHLVIGPEEIGEEEWARVEAECALLLGSLGRQ